VCGTARCSALKSTFGGTLRGARRITIDTARRGALDSARRVASQPAARSVPLRNRPRAAFRTQPLMITKACSRKASIT
jgi:hypothetical protein